MRREDKYPETKTFHYYNANPRNRITGDCAYRAITAGTEMDYNEVVRGLAEIHCKTGYEPTEGRGLEEYMKSIGWDKHPQPRKKNGTKYTGKEFCEELARRGYFMSIICNIGGHHMVAIRSAQVWDIWDSTDGCIGNYWTRGIAPI